MDATTRARLRKTWPLLIIVAVVALLALFEFQGWPFLQGPIEQSLSRRLDRRVAFGDPFSVRLLGSVRVQTSAFSIGPPAWARGASPPEKDLVQATDAQLEVPYSTIWSLLRSDPDAAPRITALRFGRVDAWLQRDAGGRANWQLLKATPEASNSQFGFPQIGELVIASGRVVLNDAVLRAELDASVSTTEGDRAAQVAGLVIQGKGRYGDQPFEARVTSSGVLPLVAPSDEAGAVPITLQINAGATRLRFEGSGVDVLGFKKLDGTLMLSGPSLSTVGGTVGLTLPTTSAFTLKGQLGKAGELWSLQRVALAVGESRLGGEFRFDRRLKVPLLSGELTGDRLVLADLLPAFGAPVAGAPNPRPPPGRVLPTREFDVPSLHAMDASVNLRLKRAELGSFFAQPFEPLQGNLDLRGGVLKVTQFLARTASGEVRGDLGLDSQPKQPVWSANLRWSGIQLERWLRPRNEASRERKPGTGEPPGFVSGRLGGSAKLRGTGNSTAKMLGSLEGHAQAWVRDGEVSHLMVEAMGLDVAEGLGRLIVGDDRLPMHCAVTRVVAAHGQVVPEVAVIDTRDSTVLVSGAVSLADELLALKLTTKPKDMSPLTLRSPVRLEGTFANPQVRLEAGRISLKLLAAAALASVTPLAGLIPLIDIGDRDPGGCDRTLQGLRGDKAAAGNKEAAPIRK